MADSSSIEIRGELAPLKGALDRAAGMFQGFGERVHGVFSRIQFALSFDNILFRIKDGIAGFIESEGEVTKMTAAIKATGGAAGFTADQLNQMNENLQLVSTHGDAAITSAQTAMLKFQNVRGDVFEEAMHGALDLAAATGGDLTSAAEKLGGALNDPIRGMMKLRSEGIVFSQDQQKLIKQMVAVKDVTGVQKIFLEALGNTFGGTAQAQAKTFGGQLMRLHEVMGDVWKAVSTALIPVLEKFVPVAQTIGRAAIYVATQFSEAFTGLGEIVEQGVSIAGEWFFKLVDYATSAFAFIKTAVEEFGSFFEGSWLSLQATSVRVVAGILQGILSFTQGAVDGFTQVINIGVDVFEHLMKLGEWFGNNFTKMWMNNARFVGEMLTNMLDNFTGFMGAIGDLISGKGFDWSWKGMEQGFRDTIDELPQFVQTKIGSVFDVGDATGLKSLIKDLNVGADVLADDSEKAFGAFSDRFAENLETSKEKVAGFVAGLKGAVSPEATDVANNGGAQTPFTISTEPKQAKDSESGQKSGAFEDLASLSKRIQSAAFKSPEAKELEKQRQEAMQQHLEMIAYQKRIAEGIDGQTQVIEEQAPDDSMLQYG